jgi:hypothetical protein
MGSLEPQANSHPARSTLVEFFGLPGVGKSYVAGLTREALSDLGIASRLGDRQVSPEVTGHVRVRRKLGSVASQGLSHPVRSIRAIGEIGTGQRDPSSALSRSVQWLVTQDLLARARRRGGVHLFEEGILQALWSIGLRGRLDGMLTLLGEGPLDPILSDLAVVVEAPMEVVRSRLGSRGSRHSRTERLAGTEREAELTRGEGLLSELLAWWESAQGADRVVRVNNADDGPPDIEAAVRRIASLATQGPQQGA